MARAMQLLWRAVRIAVAAAIAWTALAGAASAGKRWGANYFPNTTVTSHEGKTYRFYDDLIAGKIVVVNFIYTSCADICPLMTARLAEVQRRLGSAVGRDIFIYSITLDPERDTPAALAKHASAFGVGPGWLFLTGAPAELALIRHRLGERSQTLAEHRTDIVIGNDRTRQWERTSMMSDFDRIALVILEMDPAWRARQLQARQSAAAAALPPSIQSAGRRGQALFVKACAACHAIGQGDGVGPDLLDVEKRRDANWLVRFIMKPGGMRAAKDPLALALGRKFPGRTMPYLGLSTTDVADVLSYIAARSDEHHRRLKARANLEQQSRRNR